MPPKRKGEAGNDQASMWMAAIEARVTALEDMETRVAALEETVGARKQAEAEATAGDNAVNAAYAFDTADADEPAESFESGQFVLLSTKTETDEAINNFLRNPKKANDLATAELDGATVRVYPTPD